MTAHADDIECPLCHSVDTGLLSTISTADLTTIYRRDLGVDVGPLLTRNATVSLRVCAQCTLQFFTPPLPGGDDFYDQLQRSDWYYMTDKPEYQYAGALVSGGDCVLEVGSGKGAFRRYLPNDVEYTGLELSLDAVATAGAAGVKVLPEMIESHAVSNEGKYDSCFGFQVLEHIPDVRGFLNSCVRVVRPGGLLCFSVPNDEGFVGASVNEVLNMPPHHMTRWRRTTFERVAELLNLVIVAIEEEPLSPVHYPNVITQYWVAQLSRSPEPGRNVDPRWRTKMATNAGRMAAKVMAKRHLDARLLPKGHTLTAVLRVPTQ